MSITLFNYLKSIKPSEFVNRVESKEKFNQILKDLGLDQSLSLPELVEYMLVESKKLINQEKRKEAIVILKIIRKLLPSSPKNLHVIFYLTLSDSFLLANDYEGAKKSVEKADKLAKKLEDPNLQTKVLNRFFIINRTIGKDKALSYLIQSRELSEKHNFYENMVFCDVNIGLIHFFKKDIHKAIEYCNSAINILSEHPYPVDKLMMPADYFLQIFSENLELVAVSKNKELILKGIKIVLKALKHLKNEYEITRRISILSSMIRYSSDIVDTALEDIEAFIAEIPQNRKSTYYASVAGGISNYKEFQYALNYFQKALDYIHYVNDAEQRSIRKGHSYVIANLLGVSMLYDLETSSQTAQKLKNISITLEDRCLLGSRNSKIKYDNAVRDSDSAFGFTRKFVQDNLIKRMKEHFLIHPIISKFNYQKGREDILKDLDIFAINAENQDEEVISLLFVGTNIEEKFLKRSKKEFSGYQIIGHRLPSSIKKSKHKEDFDMLFLFELMTTPQHFKKIEM